MSKSYSNACCAHPNICIFIIICKIPHWNCDNRITTKVNRRWIYLVVCVGRSSDVKEWNGYVCTLFKTASVWISLSTHFVGDFFTINNNNNVMINGAFECPQKEEELNVRKSWTRWSLGSHTNGKANIIAFEVTAGENVFVSIFLEKSLSPESFGDCIRSSFCNINGHSLSASLVPFEFGYGCQAARCHFYHMPSYPSPSCSSRCQSISHSTPSNITSMSERWHTHNAVIIKTIKF